LSVISRCFTFFPPIPIRISHQRTWMSNEDSVTTYTIATCCEHYPRLCIASNQSRTALQVRMHPSGMLHNHATSNYSRLTTASFARQSFGPVGPLALVSTLVRRCVGCHGNPILAVLTYRTSVAGSLRNTSHFMDKSSRPSRLSQLSSQSTLKVILKVLSANALYYVV